jgi:hypothetical protein
MRPMILAAALIALVYAQPSHGQASLEPLPFTLTSLDFVALVRDGTASIFELFPPPASLVLDATVFDPDATGTVQVDVGLVGDSGLQIVWSGDISGGSPSLQGVVRCGGYFDVPQVVVGQAALPTTTVGLRGVNMSASSTGDIAAISLDMDPSRVLWKKEWRNLPS